MDSLRQVILKGMKSLAPSPAKTLETNLHGRLGGGTVLEGFSTDPANAGPGLQGVGVLRGLCKKGVGCLRNNGA
jgi:hypothetical protein